MWTAQPALRHLSRCGCFLPLHFYLPHPSATPTPLTANSILLQVPPRHCIPAVSLHATILHPGLHPFSTWESPTSPSRFSITPPWAFLFTPLPAVHPSCFIFPDLRQHQPFFDSSFGFHLALYFSLFLPLRLPSSVSCQSHPWCSSLPISSPRSPPSHCGHLLPLAHLPPGG